MDEEIDVLHSVGTWGLVPLPADKSLIDYRWDYNVKIGPNGRVDRLKTRSVAKGYTQIYGFDYYETFSPVAKMTSAHLFLSMATMSS